jgi:hypothetical protein
VFTEIFLVQFVENFRKYIPKFVFKAKITSKNTIPNLKTKGKKENSRGKKRCRGRKRIFQTND